MRQLVEDLLNLSLIGKTDLNRQGAKLNVLVEDARVGLKSETDGRQIEWRIRDLPFVNCDSRLIRQVFVNLLSNAIKYTEPRKNASIEAGQMDAQGEVVIYVRDNGVGFNMKYADKLFGVFERLHRSEDFKGTGVGLAIVARIVQKHGGQVWAEAEEDKGATFYFTLERKSAAK